MASYTSFTISYTANNMCGTTCRAWLILLERRRACRCDWDCALAGKAGSYNPASFIPTHCLPAPSSTLNRIALSSSNVSCRNCSSNSRSRCRTLVVVVHEKKSRRRLCATGRAGRAGGHAGATRPMVYTPVPAPLTGSGRRISAGPNSSSAMWLLSMTQRINRIFFFVL